MTDYPAPAGRMRIRTALITAAGNGLGRAAAQCLAAEGVHVAIVDHDGDAAAETAALIAQAGGSADVWVADCTDETAINNTVRQISDRLGSIDAIVNNMGGSAAAESAEFHLQTSEVFTRVVNQCLMATMLWSRAVVPAMREAGYGKIINIASDAAFVGDPGLAEYAAAKAGVIGLTRVLAMELADHGVNANAIAPGPIRTAALDRLAPAVLERAAEAIPMKRLGDPMDIGRTVAYFASTDSDFVTGQTLIVGGGRWLN